MREPKNTEERKTQQHNNNTAMNSRPTSAASSRRVKQELVRLLFGQEATSATSRHACRPKTLDHSVYSYADLRSAYLEKIQKWHPDKQYSSTSTRSSRLEASTSISFDTEANDTSITNKNGATTTTYATHHSLFVELQEAWDQYHEMAKISKKVDSDGIDKDRNFTMFGVGCSFADNDTERDMRNSIMDQAGRGWFSAGSLSAEAASSIREERMNDTDNNTGQTSSNNASNQQRPLLDDDDDMFVAVDDMTSSSNETKNYNSLEGTQQSQQKSTRKPSLVDSKFRPRSVVGWSKRKANISGRSS